MMSEHLPPLRRCSMHPDPLHQFSSWLREAEQAEIPLHDAMILATSSRSGKPSARIVLLRGIKDGGFVFFTNYDSRKAQDLNENPQAALVFYWLPLSRQVRIEGRVEKLAASESDSYFAGRPRGHQIGAHASTQSQVLKDRFYLEKRVEEVARSFAGKEVPRPPHWGGYRVVPERLEFWQEGEDRLHDRLCYRLDNGLWLLERLAP